MVRAEGAGAWRVRFIWVVFLALIGLFLSGLATEPPKADAQGGGARAWALVTVQTGKELEAFEVLRTLALSKQWKSTWQIKRIDIVTPMAEFKPKNTFSMIIAVKAVDRGTLIAAFTEINKILHERKFTHVEGHEASLKQTFELNWP